MPDNLEKVRTGDPWKPPPAKTWNDILDAVAYVNGLRATEKRRNGAAGAQPGTLRILNDTEVDQPRFAVLTLDEPVISAADNETEFTNSITMSAIAPDGPPFVVLQEPVAAAAIGHGIASGMTLIDADDVETLGNSAMVIWQDVDWALVSLSGGFGGSGMEVTLTETGATWSMPFYSGDGFDTFVMVAHEGQNQGGTPEAAWAHAYFIKGPEAGDNYPSDSCTVVHDAVLTSRVWQTDHWTAIDAIGDQLSKGQTWRVLGMLDYPNFPDVVPASGHLVIRIGTADERPIIVQGVYEGNPVITVTAAGIEGESVPAFTKVVENEFIGGKLAIGGNLGILATHNDGSGQLKNWNIDPVNWFLYADDPGFYNVDAEGKVHITINRIGPPYFYFVRLYKDSARQHLAGAGYAIAAYHNGVFCTVDLFDDLENFPEMEQPYVNGTVDFSWYADDSDIYLDIGPGAVGEHKITANDSWSGQGAFTVTLAAAPANPGSLLGPGKIQPANMSGAGLRVWMFMGEYGTPTHDWDLNEVIRVPHHL